MGRIKGTLVKRVTKALLVKYRNDFGTEFEANKQAIVKLLPMQKKIRNSVAGYVSRKVKKEQEKRADAKKEQEDLEIQHGKR